MVVTINETNYQLYREFLAEAYQYLDSKDLLDESDKNSENTFTSISQYFNYIEEIMQSERGKYFLLKLPLDETPLDIDANTRAISIPASFQKSTIVQRDKVAETIVFTINRFIDNIDLFNASDIYVQWTAPDPTMPNGVKEWATPITLIDVESVPEKIKFGWPIDDAVTKYPGTVKFSITFFIKDENSDENNAIVYRLNTLPQSFEVKAALQPDINNLSTLNYPSEYLNAAIRNNNYPNQDKLIAMTPEFVSPGLDLPETALLVNDKLQLKAQAIAPDTGVINYNWYFIPEGGSYTYQCGVSGKTIKFTPYVVLPDGTSVLRQLSKADYDLLTDEAKTKFKNINAADDKKQPVYELNPAPTETTDIELAYKTIGTVKESYLQTTVTGTPDPRDKFYVEKESNVFMPITGKEDPSEIKYEKYTLFDVPEQQSKSGIENIVGRYFIKATNTVGSGKNAHSMTKENKGCLLEGPETVEILTHPTAGEGVILTQPIVTKFLETEKNYGSSSRPPQSEYDLMLDEYKVLFESAGEGKYKLKQGVTTALVKLRYKDLSFSIKSKDNTTFEYTWKQSVDDNIDSESTFTNVGTNDTKYTALSDGWYKANISANKNRKQESEDTEICRVVSNPISPTLSVVTSGDNKTTTGEWENEEDPTTKFYMINASNKDTVVLSVDAAINVGTEDKSASKLYSDGIRYEWRRMSTTSGSVEEVLNTNDHGTYISVDKNPEFKNKSPGATFSNHPSTIKYEYDGDAAYITCYAINTLADRTTEKAPAILRFYII